MNILPNKMSARTLLLFSRFNSLLYLGFTFAVFSYFIQPQSLFALLFLSSMLLFMVNNILKNVTYKKLLKEENTKSLNMLLDKIAKKTDER